MRRSTRGIVLPPKLSAFLAEHVAVVGAARTALRLRLAAATVRALLRGYRSDVRTALIILDLSQRLGADRQQWLRDLPPIEAKPAKARRSAKVAKTVSTKPRQTSLF